MSSMHPSSAGSMSGSATGGPGGGEGGTSPTSKPSSILEHDTATTVECSVEGLSAFLLGTFLPPKL